MWMSVDVHVYPCFARTRLSKEHAADITRARARDSPLCVYHRLFYNASRGTTGFSLLNDLEAVSVISKKKNKNKNKIHNVPEIAFATAPDDMSRAYTGLISLGLLH